jgi:guanine deaminase
MYSAVRGQHYELLEWLEKVTFPMEKKFIDVDFAFRTYKIVVRRTIDLGVCPCFADYPE